MTNEQPIETIYNGYRFRSRLEARWAVFFDALDSEWEYEKQGYRLPDGTGYLPDFWLPGLDCWYEVKGNYKDTGAMWDYWARLFDFAQQMQKWVYIARGEICVPDLDAIPGNNFPNTIDGFDPLLDVDDPRRFSPGNKFPEPWFMWLQSKRSGEIKLGRRSSDLVITPKIVSAYIAARQARFEHGERGKR